jgi:hypothetical protein
MCLMWQLADETVKLFDATIEDMGVNINYFPDGQDPMSTISEYIETMRISLWKTAFFFEFSMEKGVHKNKKVEDQVNFKPAMRRVLFRYFKFMLFPLRPWQELQHSLLPFWTRTVKIACSRKLY